MKDIERFNLPIEDWEKLIDQWIFSERDRAIVKRKLLDGVCFEPLAEEFNLTDRQVKNIVYKATQRLLKHL